MSVWRFQHKNCRKKHFCAFCARTYVRRRQIRHFLRFLWSLLQNKSVFNGNSAKNLMAKCTRPDFFLTKIALYYADYAKDPEVIIDLGIFYSGILSAMLCESVSRTEKVYATPASSAITLIASNVITTKITGRTIFEPFLMVSPAPI